MTRLRLELTTFRSGGEHSTFILPVGIIRKQHRQLVITIYVHRNTKNVLFDKKWKVKSSQFGLYHMANFNGRGDNLQCKIFIAWSYWYWVCNAVDVWALNAVLLYCQRQLKCWAKLLFSLRYEIIRGLSVLRGGGGGVRVLRRRFLSL